MSVLNEALLSIVEIYNISYGHRRPLNNVNSWMILGFSVLYSKECCCGFFFYISRLDSYQQRESHLLSLQFKSKFAFSPLCSGDLVIISNKDNANSWINSFKTRHWKEIWSNFTNVLSFVYMLFRIKKNRRSLYWYMHQ